MEEVTRQVMDSHSFYKMKLKSRRRAPIKTFAYRFGLRECKDNTFQAYFNSSFLILVILLGVRIYDMS